MHDTERRDERPTSGNGAAAAAALALARYAERQRPALADLAACSPRCSELLTSCPALAFALVTGYGGPDRRRDCLLMVEAGTPLREQMGVLGLPWWLRRLPPEAFTEPLAALPDDPQFSRRIVDHIPPEPWRTAAWIKRVQVAGDIVGGEFAYWIGRRTRALPRLNDRLRSILLCAYAWYSARPDLRAARLLRAPFDARMGFRRALEEAEVWRKRIDLAIGLGNGIADSWFAPGAAHGFEFYPLNTIEDFVAEAATMHNCLDQYGTQLEMQSCRIFAVRQAGKSVATLELVPHEDDPMVAAIEQLRGPHNLRAPAGLWAAATAWLEAQPRRRLCDDDSGRRRRESAAVSRAIWQPLIDDVAGKSCETGVRLFLRSFEPFGTFSSASASDRRGGL